MQKRHVFLLTLALAVAILSGCAAQHQKDQMTAFNAAWKQGDYTAASRAMEAPSSLTGQDASEDERLLELLHQAEAHRISGDTETAIALYDEAEQGIKMNDTRGSGAKMLETGMAVLLNDAHRDYTPLLSERILINTYKGLSFLQQGDTENARIEFNRADDRTRRAIEHFSDEIQAQRAALQERQEGENSEDPRKASILNSLKSDALQSTVENHYGRFSEWGIYSEFMVPAATYLHGLYFLASDSGDLERALQSLKRVAGMEPEHPRLAADVRLAEALARGSVQRESIEPLVWVIYENGLGPVAREVRFDVPLLLLNREGDDPAYTGIALPRYRERTAVEDGFRIEAPRGEIPPLEPFSPMGKVIRTEMKARFPAVLTRAITSAVLKTTLQDVAAEKLGVLGRYGSAMLSMATTRADLRSWQALPDHWQVTRMPRPSSGQLILANHSGTLGTLDLPDWPYTLVYIKRPSTLGGIEVDLVDLQGRIPGRHLSFPGSSRAATAVAEAHAPVETQPR
ncbi:COG3014 family protein [Ectothiorhodospira mobilis]|uniref:COG3014 family protein n=1 Tax=Ectothiorhodospira mobilis TaxID=195064 RepID=UPI001907FC0B|nr:hypothetical protein [Ectothiorhodospira mobilis]